MFYTETLSSALLLHAFNLFQDKLDKPVPER